MFMAIQGSTVYTYRLYLLKMKTKMAVRRATRASPVPIRSPAIGEKPEGYEAVSTTVRIVVFISGCVSTKRLGS